MSARSMRFGVESPGFSAFIAASAGASGALLLLLGQFSTSVQAGAGRASGGNGIGLVGCCGDSHGVARGRASRRGCRGKGTAAGGASQRALARAICFEDGDGGSASCICV